MSDRDRVVITGIGIVSPIGIGKQAYFDALVSGRSGIKPVTLFDTAHLQSKLAGEIGGFDPEAILGQKGLRNLDRTTLLALSAAKLCLDDARFTVTPENAQSVGVVLGTTMGSMWSINEFDKEGQKNGPKSVNPAFFPNTVMNAPASQISIRFGIKGFNTTISSGFTSSLDALIYAKTFLKLGRAQAVLVGGVEALCEQTFKGFYRLGFLSGSNSRGPELCAPFDQRRNGVVLGEGGGMLLIETLFAAKARGATIYAELSGTGSAFDRKAYFRYSLSAEGAHAAAEKALQESGVAPHRVNYVASSANSTLDGDLAEVRAMQTFFGQKFILNAVKSMLGESMSAGGAFQIAAALLGMQENIVPPTINFSRADKRCQLIDCVPNEARKVRTESVLVTNLSPMGQNAAALITKINE
jgi:3-oxoacyl-[acyl-carrier-protein] synthase II